MATNQFHAIIGGWIVTGREHDPTVDSLFCTTEYSIVHLFGTAEADITYITALRQKSLANSRGQRRTAQAYVPSKHQVVQVLVFDKGQGNATGDILVEGVGNASTDIGWGEAAKGSVHA